MTTIIAYQNKDGAWLACDSQATRGNTKETVTKVLVKDDVVIAFSGLLSVKNNIDKMELPRGEGMSAFEYANKILIEKKADAEGMWSGFGFSECILLKGGELVKIGDTPISVKDDFASTGSGGQIALGVLSVLQEQKLKPEEMLKMAIKKVNTLDVYTNDDVRIFFQKKESNSHENKLLPFELDIEKSDDEQGSIHGILSTNDVDKDGDCFTEEAIDKIVASSKDKEVPFLLGHSKNSKIGTTTELYKKKLDNGRVLLGVKAKFDLATETGANAYKWVKEGFLKSLSIGGYRLASYIENGVQYVTNFNIAECSVVIDGRNANAGVLSVKGNCSPTTLKEAEILLKARGFSNQEADVFLRGVKNIEKEILMQGNLASENQGNLDLVKQLQEENSNLKNENATLSQYKEGYLILKGEISKKINI